VTDTTYWLMVIHNDLSALSFQVAVIGGALIGLVFWRKS
jgi:hypothetical protein